MKNPTLLILLSLGFSLHAAKPKEFIESIHIKDQTISYHINQDLHERYLREDLYVTYAADIDLQALDYTILTMPLIMNTIAIVWVSGENYTIPAMDEDLYYGLDKVREIFRRFYPRTTFDGNLIPLTLVNNKTMWSKAKKADGFALPFSHGLDSLCTSLRHRNTPQLLITVRGMPDTPLNIAANNWKETQQIINHFAKLHGHKTAYITSNFHEFFNWRKLCKISPEITHWRICMVESLGWMGLAAPILIEKKYAHFVLPANDDWESGHPGAGCPLVDESITFAGIVNTCDGFDIPRLKKNQIIADICNKHGLEKPFSMICENILKDRKNCCECQKCVASILSFLLIQEDPCEHGFEIDRSTFLDFFKTTFIKENTYAPYGVRWFQYCQKLARKNMKLLDPELQQFFTWYAAIDFNKLTTKNPRIELNYNDFIDLYDKIPQKILKRHAKRAYLVGY